MSIAIASRNLTGMAGTAALILEQIRFLVARGHRVTVYGERLNLPAIRDAGAQAQRMLRLPGPGAWSRRFFARRVVRRQQADYLIGHGDLLRQDALFLHNLVERETELLAELGQAQASVVVDLHRELFRQGSFGVVVVNSRLARDDLLERYDLKPQQVQVVYPGFDPQQFSPAQRNQYREPLRSGAGLTDEFLLAFVTSGNFPLRGADILLKTLLCMPAHLRPRVLAVGAEHNTRALARDFAAVGLGDRLLLRPKVPEVQGYYHAADLLFHPARLETFGLVVIEAAACGTPVLTSQAVGAAELLPMGAELQRPDAEAFAEKLAVLMSDKAELAALAQAQLSAVQAYHWQGYNERWYELLGQNGLPDYV